MDAVNVLIVQTDLPLPTHGTMILKIHSRPNTYKFVSETDSLKNQPTLSRKEFVAI